MLSSDKENKADVLALTGASAALHISDIPWDGPIVGIRVARKNGELVIYPTVTELLECDSTSSSPARATPSSWSRAAPPRPPRPTSSTR